MNNLITVFIDYNVKRFIEYVVFIYGKYNDFTRKVAETYIRTYIDNYYYGIFHTISDTNYSLKNLELEFNGAMEEMLYNYRQYELEVSNEEYRNNCEIIKELNKIVFEVIRIDSFDYIDRNDVDSKVSEFISKCSLLNDLIGNRLIKFISMVKSTYTMNNRLINFNDSYYSLDSIKFFEEDNLELMRLKHNIKVLDMYKTNMVSKIYKDVRLDLKKLECIVNKVSLNILTKFINKEHIDTLFIEIPDSLVSRGKIDDVIYNLIDNPLFQKYVVLVIEYNTFLNHKTAFNIDFKLACIQDFSHINDVFQKTDNIFKEGIFNYLIVSDCREKDRAFFEKYESDIMQVLLFAEEDG